MGGVDGRLKCVIAYKVSETVGISYENTQLLVVMHCDETAATGCRKRKAEHGRSS